MALIHMKQRAVAEAVGTVVMDKRKCIPDLVVEMMEVAGKSCFLLLSQGGLENRGCSCHCQVVEEMLEEPC